jgi:hypothetical protein
MDGTIELLVILVNYRHTAATEASVGAGWSAKVSSCQKQMLLSFQLHPSEITVWGRDKLKMAGALAGALCITWRPLPGTPACTLKVSGG